MPHSACLPPLSSRQDAQSSCCTIYRTMVTHFFRGGRVGERRKWIGVEFLVRCGSVPVAVIPMASKTARVMGRTHGPPQDRTRVQCSTPVGCSPPCMYGCAHRRGHFEPGAVNSKLVSAPCDKVAAWLSAIRRRDRALPRVAKARRPARGRERAFELTLNPCAPTCLGARRWPCKSGP